jgi:uncharacterized membrane protein YvbJ
MKFKIVCRIFVITFFTVVVIGFYIYWKRTEPVRVAKVFIHAVENRDVDTLYLLTFLKSEKNLELLHKQFALF